jgi:hypothetical protein
VCKIDDIILLFSAPYKTPPDHHFLLAWSFSGGIDKQTGIIPFPSHLSLQTRI